MTWEVLTGDCLEVMPTLEANSVDTIITDPPYGLSFMGKDWDHGVPGEHFWREALRVAKPGATMLAFGGTRTFHRLAVAIEDAGWEIRDVIMWVYASGFPKSHDISKAIDREAGAERPIVGRKPVGWGGLHDNRNLNDDGWDKIGAQYPEGLPITAPATPAARTWNGYGTALKPAWEPIIVAMKQTDGTFAQNAQAWGVAGLWIDGGRVEADGANLGRHNKPGPNGWANSSGGSNRATYDPIAASGRWPANLIHDGSDEVVGLFPQAGGGFGKRGGREDAIVKYGMAATMETVGYGDSGSAARFFYTAKASRGERNAGLEGMPTKTAAELTGRQPGSNGLSGSIEHGNSMNPFANGGSVLPSANYHPTVKPIALMRYLARLTKTPTGGVVLDPFAGSGSTGIGAVLEGRSFIGIEREEEYAEIARRRIAHWAAQIVQPALLETA